MIGDPFTLSGLAVLCGFVGAGLLATGKSLLGNRKWGVGDVVLDFVLLTLAGFATLGVLAIVAMIADGLAP